MASSGVEAEVALCEPTSEFLRERGCIGKRDLKASGEMVAGVMRSNTCEQPVHPRHRRLDPVEPRVQHTEAPLDVVARHAWTQCEAESRGPS